MKISVLIVAHNEERHIAGCIESLLAQTRMADEIVLISHNSTDATAELARRYPIRVIEHNGPAGSAYARIRGFEEVSGDMVLCIDGDAQAAKNWIEVMARTLKKPGTVMAGSWIRMSGTFYAELAGWRWYFFCATRGFKAADWLWGASLALWTRDRSLIIEALRESIMLSKRLGLPVNPDDYWLALFMSRHGNLEVTNKTWVRACSKTPTLMQEFKRGLNALATRKVMRAFIRSGGVPDIRIP